VAAAETLLKLGEAQKAAGTLVAASVGTKPSLRAWARRIMRDANSPHPFAAMLVKAMRDQDGGERDEALQTLQQIATPEAVQSALISALADDKTEFRRWAAERLKPITPSP
jgi:hypothetical protein